MIDKEELDAKLKDFKRLVCEQTSEFFDSESFLGDISEVSCNPDSYLVLRIEMRNCLNEIKFGVSKGKNKFVEKCPARRKKPFNSLELTKPQKK